VIRLAEDMPDSMYTQIFRQLPISPTNKTFSVGLVGLRVLHMQINGRVSRPLDSTYFYVNITYDVAFTDITCMLFL